MDSNWRWNVLLSPSADVVVAGLHAEHGLGRPAEQRTVDGARDAAAAVDAIVVLMELVAVVAVSSRIVEVTSVIVEQVQVLFDRDRHWPSTSRRRRICAIRADSEKRLVSPPSVGSSCAEKTDLSRRQRPQRHLIGGIPGVGVGHRGQREAVGRGALAVAQQGR